MDPATDEIEDISTQNQIQNKYTFWYRGGSSTASKGAPENYLESIKKISNFQTVEQFWKIYNHIKRPNEFRVTTDFHLFKEGISPTWEDIQNKSGGKWMLKLKKGIASRYWEDVLLAVIGEQFDVGPEICGAVLSVRTNEDIISVWNKTADNNEAVNKIRDQLRRILKLPQIISIEYKRHQDSLVDKSSYRNPTMVWRAPSKPVPNPNATNAHQSSENNKSSGYNNNNNNYYNRQQQSYENKGLDRGSSSGTHSKPSESGGAVTASKPAWQTKKDNVDSINKPSNREESGWQRGIGSKDNNTVAAAVKKAPEPSAVVPSKPSEDVWSRVKKTETS